MEFTGRKLLILAGADVHVKVVRAAQEMGIYTVVTDYLEDSPAKRIANDSWMLSITDVDGIVNKCRENGIDAVLNCCNDLAQKPYCEICEQLHLPCFGTKEQYKIMTEKTRFKQFCMANDVGVIPDYSYEEIQNDAVHYPVMVKPAECRGSRGQFICNTKEDALQAYREAQKISLNGEAICEELVVNAQDIASAFFVINGEPHLVKFGDRFLGLKSDGLNRQVMCTRFPSTFSKKFEARCLPKVKEMIKTLGIQFGPVFLQGFSDGNDIYYYDPALRMPGSDYDLMLKEATGFDSVKSMIYFAMTGDSKTCFGNPEDAYLLNGKTGLLFTVSVRPGKINTMIGLETIKKHPSVVFVQQKLKEGDIVQQTGNVRQRVAEIGIILKADEEPAGILQYVYDTFHVLDEHGEEMIVSRVTKEQLA